MLGRLSIATACAAVSLGLAGQATAADVTLRLETYAPPSHAMNATAWPGWAKQVAEASGGRLAVEMSYPPIDPRDLYDRVRDGIADVAWITHGYTTGRFVLPEIADLPGHDGNAEQMSVAHWRIHKRHMEKFGEHKGVEVLAMFTHGPGMLHTRVPINSIADVKGLKIRTGGGVQSDISKRLDLVSVSAPATKAQELLAQGVADGILFSIESITSLKLGEVVKYHYSYPGNLYGASFAVVMTKSKYEGLSAADKAALQKVAGEQLSAHIGRTWDGADQVSVKALTASGNTIQPFNDATLGGIRERLADLDGLWVGKAKEIGLSDPGAALADYRAEVQNAKKGM